MTLKTQRDIKIINSANAIVDIELLKKAMLWYANGKPITSIKKIGFNGMYPCVSFGRKKLPIHKLIGLYLLGKRSVSSEYVFHHVNHNKMDARASNIKLMNKHDHLSMHNKGRIVTEKMRERLLEMNHARKGKRFKYKHPEIKPIDVYNMVQSGKSITSIAKFYGVRWNCIRHRYEDAIELLNKFDKEV